MTGANKNSWLTRSLLGIGLTSLLSDMGHEMTTAILPIFLASIGGTAATLGLIEGIVDASSSFVKIATTASDLNIEFMPLTLVSGEN